MQQSFYNLDRPKTNLERLLILTSLLALSISGCGSAPKEVADAQTRQGGQQDRRPASVDVAVARTAVLQSGLEYVGTTQPYRQVSLRTQVEGQLLSLRGM
jgi:HlyD family secretion protein